MENSTELVFILDRSGSMAGLEADTIGGYNAMLEKQRAVPGEARVTTVLFDNQYELLHDRIDLRAVAPITEKGIFCARFNGAARCRRKHNRKNWQRAEAYGKALSGGQGDFHHYYRWDGERVPHV